MSTVTTSDRETAERIVSSVCSIYPTRLTSKIAAAIAEQRERLTQRHIADLERIASELDVQSVDFDMGVLFALRICRERIAELKATATEADASR